MKEVGIHTFSQYHSLLYYEAGSLIDKLMSYGRGYFMTVNKTNTKRIYFCYHFAECGVLMYVYQMFSASGISLRISPCTLLSGRYAPTDLYNPLKKDHWGLENRLNIILEELKLNPKIEADQMSISRADPCMNLYLDDADKVAEYIRVLKKSSLIPRYELDSFQVASERVKDIKAANAHSYRIKSKKASFTAYDKVYELQQMERCPQDLADTGVLRIEAGLKRDALLKKIHTNRDASNYEILKKTAENTSEILSSYLRQLKIGTGDYIQYKSAQEQIEKSGFQSNIKERMLFLLRKVSDSNSLDIALRKTCEEYNLTKEQREMILKKFDELGICPITLRNDSEFVCLPSLLSLVTQEKTVYERDADGFIILIPR